MMITIAIIYRNNIVMNKFNSKSGNVTMVKLSTIKLSMAKSSAIFHKLFIAIALTSTSFTATADRPAMDEETANIAQERMQQKKMRQAQPAVQQQAAAQQPTQTTGDVLVLPPKEIQAGETINIKKINVPRRGIKMNEVRRQLGEPIATSASIGQPPITHWTYKDRIVYFEYSTVLHVVAR